MEFFDRLGVVTYGEVFENGKGVWWYGGMSISGTWAYLLLVPTMK